MNLQKNKLCPIVQLCFQKLVPDGLNKIQRPDIL